MATIKMGLRLLGVVTVMVAMTHLIGMLVIIGRGPIREETSC